jgi:PAS domain S-box-containing protein
MQFQYTPYILPLLAASIVCGGVAVYAWLRRSTERVLAFTVVLTALSILIWAFGYALEIAGADLDTKYIWGVIQYFGIAFVPYGWFLFSIRYSAPTRDLSPRFIFLTALIPSITLLLALTTKWHALVWTEYHISRHGNFSALEISHGIWFWVHWVYSYILLLIGTILLMRTLFRKQGLYRRQIVALIIAALAPWIANVLYVSGNSPIPYLDLTPFAFTITIAMLAWGIFGFQLIDLTPIARDLVVDDMSDGLLVLDVQNRIADLNPAAQRMIGRSASQVIGRTAAEVFKAWPELLERYRDVQEAQDEITIGEGEAQRHFELRLAPLRNRRGHRIGQIVAARDISVQKQMQERLERQNEYLSVLHQITLDLLDRQDMEAVLSKIVTQAASLLHSAHGFVFLADGDSLVLRAATENFRQHISEREPQPGTGFLRLVWQTAQPQALEDYAIWADAVSEYAAKGIHAIAGAPIRIGEVLVGTLEVARVDQDKRTFTAEDVSILERLAALVSLVLDNVGLYDSALKEIEERKQAEDALRLAEARYREIYETVQDVIYETDYHGILTSISPSVKTYTGSRPEDLVGRPVSELFVNPNDYAALDSEVIIKGGLKDYEISIKGKNGKEVIGSFNAQILFDQQGQPIGTRGIARDVTERKRAEEQVRQLSRAVEESGNTVLILDRNGIIEYVNPKFSEVTGFSPAEAIGKSPMALARGFENEPDFSKDEWWVTVNAGQTWYGEFQNRRKDGSVFWESATVAPVHNLDGEVTNFVEIKQDITDQKILQNQLQKQNDYLLILQQVTLDLLDRRDPNNLLKTIVERSTLLLDAPQGTITFSEGDYLVVRARTNNLPFQPGTRADRTMARLTWKAHDTGEPVVMEDYAARPDRISIYGANPPHATANFPIMLGKECIGVLTMGRITPNYPFSHEQIETGVLFARLVALVMDNASLYDSALKEIEERKRAETRLQESEIRFRKIVENASDIIYRTDANGYFTYVNPTGVYMMGFSSESDLIGKHYLDLVLPSARHKLKRALEHQLMSRTMNAYQEFIAVTANGHEIWIGQNVQLIMDGNEIIGCQAVARDITRLKQTQEALALSRDQALEASRLKSQLLANVSHELRTPLGSILGFSELLIYDSYGPLTNEQQGAIEEVIDSANYLTELINDLLDEAKLEANAVTLNNAPFSPRQFLDQVQEQIDILANNKHLQLTAAVSSDMPELLYGDVHRLRQILVNLVGNAIKFTKTGKVDMCLLRLDAEKWAMRVTDTGPGIPVEARSYIFEPFRQVDGSVARQHQGTGLGLSIVKQLTNLMDGEITLESEIHKGSVFTVILPFRNLEG